MKNFTFSLLCVGIFIAAACGDYFDNDTTTQCQILGRDCREDVDCCGNWRCNQITMTCQRQSVPCQRLGSFCRVRECCENLRCDMNTKRCVPQYCKLRGQTCEKNSECCMNLRCDRNERRCTRRNKFTPEE